MDNPLKALDLLVEAYTDEVDDAEDLILQAADKIEAYLNRVAEVDVRLDAGGLGAIDAACLRRV